jgi:hypothetical protein
MRIYLMAQLEDYPTLRKERCIYYNSNADIVFFRIASSAHTMTSLFRTGLTIPRVALELARPTEWNRPSTTTSDVDGRMRLLSGYAPMLFFGPPPAPVPGCKGLREVFWVLEGERDALSPKLDKIDGYVENRSFEPREIACGWASANFMKEYAEAHKWAGKHHTSRLCLNPGSGKICQRIFLYPTNNQEQSVQWSLLDIKESTGCEVALSEGGWGAGLYFLNFVGTPETVESAMQEFAEVSRRYREPPKPRWQQDWQGDYDDDREQEEDSDDGNEEEYEDEEEELDDGNEGDKGQYEDDDEQDQRDAVETSDDDAVMDGQENI